MSDLRLATLADLLLDHSCRLRSGGKVLIEAFDLPDEELVCLLVEGAGKRGATPFVSWKSNRILRSLYSTLDEPGFVATGAFEAAVMGQMDAYIGVRGSSNSAELSDVPSSQMELFQKHWWNAVHTSIRVPKTNWVVLRYPTDAFAQAAGMSSEAFADFYFDACTADYAAMEKRQQPLVERMRAANDVRIKGEGTDLRFSIAGMPVRPCFGTRNIPDGEVFTAPIRDSVEGRVRYNASSRYQGVVFDGVEFEFAGGKITRAECRGRTERLNEILDSDEGARYIGEWSLGCNARITQPMLDTLFDEKIAGSFHLTPGQAYEDCDNGNRSCIHWDLVCIQTPAYGGGEVWFDDELIRRDGRFIPEDLRPLDA